MAKEEQFVAEVSSRPPRFRRAGIEFTQKKKPVTVDKKTLEVLKAEPMLAVHSVEEAKETEKKEDNDTGKNKKTSGGKK